MSEQTTFFDWNFPDENEDPYFEKIKEFYNKVDDATFGILNTACNIIIPPPSLAWNSGTKTLTWATDFEIPLYKLGFVLFVKFGPDNATRSVTFNDGDRLIVTVPRSASNNVYANFSKVTGDVAVAHGLFTAGFCRGSVFYANFPQAYT